MINWIKNNSLIAIAVLLAISFAVFKLYKTIKAKVANVDASALVVLKEQEISASKYGMYKKLTIDIAQNLGTSYSKFDPRSWTENDQRVFDIMVNLSKNDIDIISKLYFNVYAKGKNLRNDLASFLDGELYSKLRNLA